MKKIGVLLFIAIMMFSISCKRSEQGSDEQATKATHEKRYAKYKISVSKDQELKTWLATLEKAEEVDLIKVEDYTTQNKKVISLATIRLSDDKEGYINANHLADQPIVFIQDTKAFVRNNIGSQIYAVIPKGKIGFIIEQKGDWVQIYIGELKGKWLTQQWVNSGYSTDSNLILDARTYEEAVALNEKENKIEEAKLKLRELSQSSSFFGEMAREKLDELEGKATGGNESQTQSGDSGAISEGAK